MLLSLVKDYVSFSKCPASVIRNQFTQGYITFTRYAAMVDSSFSMNFNPNVPSHSMFQHEYWHIYRIHFHIFMVHCWCSCIHANLRTFLWNYKEGSLTRIWLLYHVPRKSLWMVWRLTCFCLLPWNKLSICFTVSQLFAITIRWTYTFKDWKFRNIIPSNNCFTGSAITVIVVLLIYHWYSAS